MGVHYRPLHESRISYAAAQPAPPPHVVYAAAPPQPLLLAPAPARVVVTQAPPVVVAPLQAMQPAETAPVGTQFLVPAGSLTGGRRAHPQVPVPQAPMQQVQPLPTWQAPIAFQGHEVFAPQSYVPQTYVPQPPQCEEYQAAAYAPVMQHYEAPPTVSSSKPPTPPEQDATAASLQGGESLPSLLATLQDRIELLAHIQQTQAAVQEQQMQASRRQELQMLMLATETFRQTRQSSLSRLDSRRELDEPRIHINTEVALRQLDSASHRERTHLGLMPLLDDTKASIEQPHARGHVEQTWDRACDEELDYRRLQSEHERGEDELLQLKERLRNFRLEQAQACLRSMDYTRRGSRRGSNAAQVPTARTTLPPRRAQELPSQEDRQATLLRLTEAMEGVRLQLQRFGTSPGARTPDSQERAQTPETVASTTAAEFASRDLAVTQQMPFFELDPKVAPFAREGNGLNVALSQDGYTVKRSRGSRQGVVIGSAPLSFQLGGRYFELEVQDVTKGWISGLGIGVTLMAPGTVRPRMSDKASFLPSTWVVGYRGEAHLDGVQKVTNWRPEELQNGQRVGLLISEVGELVVFVDGAPVVNIKDAVPRDIAGKALLYPLVDVCHSTKQVTLRQHARAPEKPWEVLGSSA